MTTIFEHAAMNGIRVEPISRYFDEGFPNLPAWPVCAASLPYPRPIHHRERGVIFTRQSG